MYPAVTALPACCLARPIRTTIPAQRPPCSMHVIPPAVYLLATHHSPHGSMTHGLSCAGHLLDLSLSHLIYSLLTLFSFRLVFRRPVIAHFKTRPVPLSALALRPLQPICALKGPASCSPSRPQVRFRDVELPEEAGYSM